MDVMEPHEIEQVDSEVFSCDGGGGPMGHPRVFLNMEGKRELDCPYCGRRFILKDGAGDGAGH